MVYFEALFFKTFCVCNFVKFQHYPHRSHRNASSAHHGKHCCCCEKAFTEIAGGIVLQMYQLVNRLKETKCVDYITFCCCCFRSGRAWNSCTWKPSDRLPFPSFLHLWAVRMKPTGCALLVRRRKWVEFYLLGRLKGVNAAPDGRAGLPSCLTCFHLSVVFQRLCFRAHCSLFTWD